MKSVIQIGETVDVVVVSFQMSLVVKFVSKSLEKFVLFHDHDHITIVGLLCNVYVYELDLKKITARRINNQDMTLVHWLCIIVFALHLIQKTLISRRLIELKLSFIVRKVNSLDKDCEVKSDRTIILHLIRFFRTKVCAGKSQTVIE